MCLLCGDPPHECGGAIIHLSCCKHRIMPTACRFRIYRGNGSTCPRARTRSSLISAKVRTVASAAPYCMCPRPLMLTSRCLDRSPSISFRPVFFSRMHFGTHDVGCVHIGLEKVTQGLARATSHRVLAPAAGTSPRYSIPFFQNLAQDVRLSEHVLQRTFSLRLLPMHTQRNSGCFSTLCCWTVPPEVLKLNRRRDGKLDQIDCE